MLPSKVVSHEVLWLLLTLMVFFLGALFFVLVLRRKAGSALKESIAQANLLLNSAAEGIYGLDLEGHKVRLAFCSTNLLMGDLCKGPS